jgi:hypothetical protein
MLTLAGPDRLCVFRIRGIAGRGFYRRIEPAGLMSRCAVPLRSIMFEGSRCSLLFGFDLRFSTINCYRRKVVIQRRRVL